MKELVRPFGVELEFLMDGVSMPLEQGAAALTAAGLEAKRESYNHRRRTHWKVVQDSSVQDANGYEGGEAVSPVLTGEDGIAELTKAANALRDAGFETNKSCGTHVHFGLKGFGIGSGTANENTQQREIATTVRFIKNYMLFERTLDRYQLPSRRGNVSRYSRSIGLPDGSQWFSPEYLEDRWKVLDTEQVRHGASTVQMLRDAWTNLGFGRDYKLNPLPLWDSEHAHRTLEVRHLHGTLNAVKIVNWIRLMNDIWIASAAEKEHESLYVPQDRCIEHMFDWLETDVEVREYFTQQSTILGSQTGAQTCGQCGARVNRCVCQRERCSLCSERDCSCCQSCTNYEYDCVCCSNCGENRDAGACSCAVCTSCGSMVEDDYDAYRCPDESHDNDDTPVCIDCCDVEHDDE